MEVSQLNVLFEKQIEEFMKSYLKEHLKVKVEIEREYGSDYEPIVKVSLLLDEEVISSYRENI